MSESVEKQDSPKEYTYFGMLTRTIPIVFRATGINEYILILLSVIHGLSWTLTVVVTQYLFDAIANAAAGSAGFWDCFIPLLVLAGATFGQQILNGVVNFFCVKVIWPKAQGKITAILHRKLQLVDPALFEDVGFLDNLNKAKEALRAVPFFAELPFILITFYGTYFVSIGAYLFSLKPMLLFTLLLAFVPAILSQIVRTKVFTKLEEQSAPLRREAEYYQKTICDREYFKETRVLGAFRFFHKLFTETMTLLTRKMWHAERKTALLQLALDVVSFVGMAVTSYMLFTATMAGEITVGAFGALFAAIGQIFYLMQEIINNHIGNMSKDLGKVANFIRMLDMPERAGVNGTSDFTRGVVAENISFTYPGRDTPAVNGVSLTIADGETIAIVGENGAGKSTLVRLLTGIYRPSAGKVLIGGLDTATTATISVCQGISGVFQKYQRYKMTLEDNVTISDADAKIDNTRVKTALKEADTELGVELDTMLSPEFDGIDLSGGQWQRVAIARGLYRANGFIVLDEPTSAIDPIEETRIYTQFQRLAKGKCSIVVTHRLGSAKLAHRIVVMDGGQIIDVGTHNELLARSGKYADMWAAQVIWYERDNPLVM